MAGNITINDVGNIIRLTVKDQDAAVVDISAASAKNIILKNPAGSETSYNGSFTTDGTDGVLQYAAATGVWSTGGAGEWSARAMATIASGTFYSDWYEFTVIT